MPSIPQAAHIWIVLALPKDLLPAADASNNLWLHRSSLGGYACPCKQMFYDYWPLNLNQSYPIIHIICLHTSKPALVVPLLCKDAALQGPDTDPSKSISTFYQHRH